MLCTFNLYNCDFCNKSFSNKNSLTEHNNVCKSKKTIEIINEREFYEQKEKELREFYETQIKQKEKVSRFKLNFLLLTSTTQNVRKHKNYFRLP